MPIFEYHCPECGTDCEVFIRGGESPACPTCSSTQLEKLMSAPAGHVAGGSRSLPMLGSSCPPSSAPPCHPGCCRIPQS
ncbi:FmdB family zinc ribbon protein [Planctomicrobium sp. SH661]|uniref:FmdB family zinc ribbon protein n=1 Tax=Planctomicrobium sp. SH661 TaxID=3448124 RepID=UPI003F5B5ADB